MLLQFWWIYYLEGKSLSTWQKFEYIEFGCVCRSEKHVWDFLKTILDQWLSPSLMQEPCRPSQTDVRCAHCRAGGCPRCWSPKISWHEMPFQSLSVFYRSLLYIFRPVETEQNLKFRYPIRVLDSTSGEIDILPFVQKELVVEFLLSDFEGIIFLNSLIRKTCLIPPLTFRVQSKYNSCYLPFSRP